MATFQALVLRCGVIYIPIISLEENVLVHEGQKILIWGYTTIIITEQVPLNGKPIKKLVITQNTEMEKTI